MTTTRTTDADGQQLFNLALVNETVAATLPDKEAVVFGDRRFTYSQLAERSRRLANYLHAQGLGVHTDRGDLQPHESGQDHVGIYLYNGNEYIESMLGTFKSRTVPFNVNYRYVAEELRYIFDNAKAKAIIYHAAFAPTLAELLPEMPDVRVLIQVADDSGNELLDGAVDYETVIADSPDELPDIGHSPDDLYMVYTGGTTGMPKGVLWRQHDIFMNAMGGKQIGTWELMTSYEQLEERARNNADGGMKLMPLPPLMHGAAQWAVFMMLAEGSSVIMPRHSLSLDAKDIWQTAEREGVMSIALVGDAMAKPLIEEFEAGDYDASQLFVVGNGGATFSPAMKARFLENIPHLFLHDSIGSSEAGAQASQLTTAGTDGNMSFSPGPGAVVVNDLVTEILEPGHEGIGWLAQEGYVPLGYLGDANKTAATFPTINGVRYVVPGDRAIHHADGIIELLGRDSQCINSGGEKIFVEEVETAISSHPAIQDVVVCGRPSERWGNEVVAIIALTEEARTGSNGAVDEAELEAHAAKSIARYKLPKAWVFKDKIQRSPSGKADYRWAKRVATDAS